VPAEPGCRARWVFPFALEVSILQALIFGIDLARGWWRQLRHQQRREGPRPRQVSPTRRREVV